MVCAKLAMNRTVQVGIPQSGAAAIIVVGLICLVGLAGSARSQTVAIEPRFENAGHFHEGIAPVMLNGAWGFIDRGGNWVVEPTYSEIMSGSGGRFAVKAGGHWGFLNTTGAMIITPLYDQVQRFQDGVAAVKRDGLWGHIGPTGRVETAFQYRRITPREDGFFTAAWDDGLWISVDGHGSATQLTGRDETLMDGDDEDDVTEPDDAEVTEDDVAEPGEDMVSAATGFVEGFTIATTERGALAIHKMDNVLIGPFKSMRRFSERFAAISKDGELWGYVDQTGKEVIPARFEDAREFVDGVAPVQIGGKWGFIDRTGVVVFEPQYDAAYPFRETFALVRTDNKRGFVMFADGQVTEWLPPKYEDAYSFAEGMAPVKENGLWGYIASGVNVPVIREIADLRPE